MHLEIPWVDRVVASNEEVKDFPLETLVFSHLGERRVVRGESQPTLSSFGDIRCLPGEVTSIVLRRGWGDLKTIDGIAESKLDVEDA